MCIHPTKQYYNIDRFKVKLMKSMVVLSIGMMHKRGRDRCVGHLYIHEMSNIQ